MRLVRLAAVEFLYVVSFFDILGGVYFILNDQYSVGAIGIVSGLLMFFGIKFLYAKRSQ